MPIAAASEETSAASEQVNRSLLEVNAMSGQATEALSAAAALAGRRLCAVSR